MGYPDKIVLHVTEPMRANIELLATRRRNDIENLLRNDAIRNKFNEIDLRIYHEELFTLESIIAECRQAGT